MPLSLQKRRSEDDRTIGKLFLMMVDELADTTFAQAMQMIVDVILQTLREHFALTEKQLLDFACESYDRLSSSMLPAFQPGSDGYLIHFAAITCRNLGLCRM